MEQPIPGNTATIKSIVNNPNILESKTDRLTDVDFPSGLSRILSSLFTLFLGFPPLNLYHRHRCKNRGTGFWFLAIPNPFSPSLKHLVDMCSYQVFRKFYPTGALPPIPVYGPAGTADRLDRAVGVDGGLRVSDAFDFVTLAAGTVEIGPLTVTAGHMSHPVETFGFRLEHGGRVIAYSADTGPTDRLVSLAAGADVLLCEASFTEGPDLPADLHLTPRQAGEHAARAGVGRLVLTHLMPWNDRERALAEAAASYPGPLSLAAPGQVI